MLHMAAKASPTAELWRERVLAQRNSGQSVRGWCRANNCPEHGFYWWRANLGLSPASKRKQGRRTAASVGFARVVGEPLPSVAAEPMRLTLAGGRELLLPASMPVVHIGRLLRAIEGAA